MALHIEIPNPVLYSAKFIRLKEEIYTCPASMQHIEFATKRGIYQPIMENRETKKVDAGYLIVASRRITLGGDSGTLQIAENPEARKITLDLCRGYMPDNEVVLLSMQSRRF